MSKQLFREALNQDFDEPKQWEIREINEIMNQCVTGWKYFPNPRIFEGYGAASKGVCPLNASPAPAPGSPDPDSSALFGAQRNPLCGTHRRYVICRNRGSLCRSGDEKKTRKPKKWKPVLRDKVFLNKVAFLYYFVFLNSVYLIRAPTTNPT